MWLYLQENLRKWHTYNTALKHAHNDVTLHLPPLWFFQPLTDLLAIKGERNKSCKYVLE